MMETIQTLMADHGGLVGLIMAVVLAMMAFVSGMIKLIEVFKGKAPAPLQRVLSALQWILDFMTANLPHSKGKQE
jgi:hypothetical protein